VLAQTEAVWGAIERCWSVEVYMPELGYRFWKLTLQVGIARRFGVRTDGVVWIVTE
jgi:hypothetical protein